MRFNSVVNLRGIKESEGEMEGRKYSSCTFHCDVDLKENGAGRSLGSATRPFKVGDAAEFEKWIGVTLPVECNAIFEMKASGSDRTDLVLVSIAPVAKSVHKAQA